MKNQLNKHLLLFSVGAFLYAFIEVLYDGSTHWTMGLLGGICFVLIGLLNENFDWNLSILKQGIIGSTIITSLEFLFGCFLNLCLDLNIWDYSDLPFNVLGQVCLPFGIIWFVLSLFAIVLDDYLRYWFFDEEKPHYKI